MSTPPNTPSLHDFNALRTYRDQKVRDRRKFQHTAIIGHGIIILASHFVISGSTYRYTEGFGIIDSLIGLLIAGIGIFFSVYCSGNLKMTNREASEADMQLINMQQQAAGGQGYFGNPDASYSQSNSMMNLVNVLFIVAYSFYALYALIGAGMSLERWF